MSDLDRILQEIWPEVRKRHLFPELPAPTCAEGEQRVGLDMKKKRISISKEFVEEMARGMRPAEVLEGLLDHALSHYLYCPWDFSTHLKLYGEAKKVLRDKEMARTATDYFMDVVADTYCISQKDTPLPKIYKNLKRSNLDQAIHALCQRIWGVDLGVAGFEEISRKLSRIPYMDRSRWRENIRRFSKAVRTLLETEKEMDPSSSNRKGPIDSHEFHQYSVQEIEQGLKELASETATPSEFKEIVEDFEKELSEATGPAGQGMGLGPGQSVDADILYYMKLAENYLLAIRKRPVHKSGDLYPHRHVPWEVGRPFRDIDPWTSFGKIMPGITQSWKRIEGDVFGREEGIPDCIVIIDSSGSMTDPKRHLSHAVLGAACACDAYLRNDAKVAVYNFSDAYSGGQQILPYSRNRKEIYRTLCHYFGGGTQLLVENIQGLQTERVPDIFLITDMQITNLEALIQYFNESKNRITAVHIGDNKRAQTFRRSMAVRKNVSIYPVDKKEDILRIVLGKIWEYLYSGRS